MNYIIFAEDAAVAPKAETLGEKAVWAAFSRLACAPSIPYDGAARRYFQDGQSGSRR